MRPPGFEPGREAWKASMIPLHHGRGAARHSFALLNLMGLVVRPPGPQAAAAAEDADARARSARSPAGDASSVRTRASGSWKASMIPLHHGRGERAHKFAFMNLWGELHTTRGASRVPGFPGPRTPPDRRIGQKTGSEAPHQVP